MKITDKRVNPQVVAWTAVKIGQVALFWGNKRLPPPQHEQYYIKADNDCGILLSNGMLCSSKVMRGREDDNTYQIVDAELIIHG